MHVAAALRWLHFMLAQFQAGGLIHHCGNCSGIVARDASLLLLGWLACNFEGESDAWWKGGVPGRRDQNLHAGSGIRRKHVWGGFVITREHTHCTNI